MVTAKKPFPSDQVSNTQLEFRTPIALEFIAHYLDRIDSHLERLADAAEAGKPNEKLVGELRGLVHLLARK